MSIVGHNFGIDIFLLIIVSLVFILLCIVRQKIYYIMRDIYTIPDRLKMLENQGKGMGQKSQKILKVIYQNKIIEGLKATFFQKEANRDILDNNNKGEIIYSKSKEFGPNYLVFKVECRINDTVDGIAEIDSDSMLSLMSLKLYNKLKEKNVAMEFLKEKEPVFEGMGGASLTSPYPPLILQIQIGKVIFLQRFAIIDNLRNDLLIGSDCMNNHNLSVAPFSNDQWCVTLGYVDAPLTRVKALVCNRVGQNIVTRVELKFEPFEIKEIEVPYTGTKKDNHIVVITPHNFTHYPFKISGHPQYEEKENFTVNITVHNQTDQSQLLPEKFPLATCNVIDKEDLPFSEDPVTQFEDSKEFLNIEDIEPGFSPENLLEKDQELLFIKNHPKIPKDCKEKLLTFLDTVPNLYSGNEFSPIPFPGYQHDIELIDESITEVRCKPYPCQGIRLSQLKGIIDDMVKNNVLEVGDSEYLSPVFFVTKKASDGTTVRKARVTEGG